MVNTQNEKRFEMFKTILEKNRTNYLSRDNIYVTYMEVLNKAKTAKDIDDTLDAILENERLIKMKGKGKL